MKIKNQNKFDYDIVSYWQKKALAAHGPVVATETAIICSELCRYDWGNEIMEHVWDVFETKGDRDRYVKVCTYPHTVDTWASTIWALKRLCLYDLVDLIYLLTNKPVKVKCPVCGKSMSLMYPAEYNIQGLMVFRHSCRHRNLAYREFRYVPNVGWHEVCKEDWNNRKKRKAKQNG